MDPGVFLCCEIFTVVRVDSSHCLRMKFIYSMGTKRALINVTGELRMRIVIYKAVKTKGSMVRKIPNFRPLSFSL